MNPNSLEYSQKSKVQYIHHSTQIRILNVVNESIIDLFEAPVTPLSQHAIKLHTHSCYITVNRL